MFTAMFAYLMRRPAASNRSLDTWKQSFNISDIYFVTATFSSECMPYFPNKAYHYIVASFADLGNIMREISKISSDKSIFIFNLSDSLFERSRGEVKLYLECTIPDTSTLRLKLATLQMSLPKETE